jgi:hypothetical protein
MWHRYLVEPDTPALVFEHDKRNRLFILTWPDGRTETFRDNPAGHLLVEPDPQTGEMRPEAETGTRLDNNYSRPRFIPRVPVSFRIRGRRDAPRRRQHAIFSTTWHRARPGFGRRSSLLQIL